MPLVFEYESSAVTKLENRVRKFGVFVAIGQQ